MHIKKLAALALVAATIVSVEIRAGDNEIPRGAVCCTFRGRTADETGPQWQEMAQDTYRKSVLNDIAQLEDECKLYAQKIDTGKVLKKTVEDLRKKYDPMHKQAQANKKKEKYAALSFVVAGVATISAFVNAVKGGSCRATKRLAGTAVFAGSAGTGFALSRHDLNATELEQLAADLKKAEDKHYQHTQNKKRDLAHIMHYLPGLLRFIVPIYSEDVHNTMSPNYTQYTAMGFPKYKDEHELIAKSPALADAISYAARNGII